MEPSELEHYRAVNSIVERDSTFATYKYALLRGTIEICREYPHLKREEGSRVYFPLGLLIEKWLLSYYPILSADRFIPQQGGEKEDTSRQISFRRAFQQVIDFYRDIGGYSQWYSDYQRGRIPKQIQREFIDLCKKVRSTIITMPMDHLGYSQYGEPYSVLDYPRKRLILPKYANPDRDFLINQFGEFYFVRKEIFEVFTLFGGYLTGETTVLRKWAELTHRLDETVGIGDMISLLSRYPVEERNVQAAERFCAYLGRRNIPLTCAWSGRSLTGKEMHLDHLLPFSICRNNDLWNLMPAFGPFNEQKSNKIPSGDLLERQKGVILTYWTLMSEFDPDTFFRELRISLTGNMSTDENWQENAFDRLMDRCRFMTGMLGYEEWSGP
jgi:hypothetical protein